MRNLFGTDATSARSLDTDRRRNDRLRADRVTFARLKPIDGSPEALCIAQLRDVSLRGIGVTMFRPVEPGMTFMLDASSGEVAQWAQYRIVRCEGGGSCGFHVGAELIRSAPGQAQRIMDALVPGQTMRASVDAVGNV